MPFEFHIGTMPSSSRTTPTTSTVKRPSKCTKKQKQKKSNDSTAKRTVREVFQITQSFGTHPYYILPRKDQPFGLSSVLYQAPRSPAQQHRWLLAYIRKVADEKKNPSKGKSTFEFKMKEAKPAFYFSTLPPISLVKSELERNRKVHAALRRFVHIWRVKHLKATNTEDIVTCELPIHPVVIVDWSQKTSTVFEANTLMRDITACLLHHDGFFEEPKALRNPLTNLPLTQSQLISVWTQLMKSGVPASAAFAQFRQARYSLANFHLAYSTSLRLHAFRDTMKNMLAYDTKECIFNFIDLCSETFEKSYSLTKLTRDIRSEDPRYVLYFQKWRKYCMEHYEADLLYGGQEDSRNAIQTMAIRKTRFLLENEEYFAKQVVRVLFPPSAPTQPQAEADDADDEESESDSEDEAPIQPQAQPQAQEEPQPHLGNQPVDIFLPFAPTSNEIPLDAAAMNVLLNLLLDMEDPNLTVFLPQ